MSFKIHDKIKSVLRNQGRLSKVVSYFYTLIGLNCIKVRHGNFLTKSGAYLYKSRIDVKGNNNTILLETGVHLSRFKCFINGNDNIVCIHSDVSGSNLEIVIDDNHNNVEIGEKTIISGKTHLACIEGTKILIGKESLLSANITMRTGDSHSVLDLTGKRINYSKDIIIGNHVWIGGGVIILKGGYIGDNSIIGAGAVVTRHFSENNVAVAGNPATIVKKSINWDKKRI